MTQSIPQEDTLADEWRSREQRRALEQFRAINADIMKNQGRDGDVEIQVDIAYENRLFWRVMAACMSIWAIAALLAVGWAEVEQFAGMVWGWLA